MNKNEKLIKTRLFIARIIPEYAWIPLLFELSFNMLTYSGTKLITGNWVHHNIETAMDLSIPFLPWTILIYFGCYIFWIVNYIMCCRQGKEATWRFLSADFLAKVVCLFFFLVYPTTNTRPLLEGNGIFICLMRFLYQVDDADNLFPSIHCLCSWFCYIGIRGRKNIPFFYRLFSLIFALAVFISTLTTKQHVLADVIGGFLLAELAYYVANNPKIRGTYQRIFDKINRRIWQ